MNNRPGERLGFAKKLRRILNSTPTDRLSEHARRWIKEWNQTNPSRKQAAYPFFTHYLNWATEHPFYAVLPAVLVAVALTASHQFEVFPLPGLNQPGVTPEERLDQLETVWTIQATVTALVYPIVLAFVTLLLRTKASAKALLQVYLVETGAMVAGISSMTLVLAIGIGYALIVFLDNRVTQAVLLLALPWLVLNGYLTTRFLYKTLLFLNDDHRLPAIERFAVHIALPREVYAHLLRHILWRAQEQGLLPGKHSNRRYENQGPPDDEPSIDLSVPSREGTAVVVLRTTRRCQLTDVRLRPLRWGLNLWLWMCWRQRTWSELRKELGARLPRFLADDRITQSTPEKDPPILSLQLSPNVYITGKRTAFKLANGRQPGWVSRFLLRSAFVLGKPKPREQSYRPHDLLRELIQDLIEVTPKGTYEVIRDRLLYVTHIHAALLDAGVLIDDDGNKANAALIANTEDFFSKSPSSTWADEYHEWLQEAVREMEQNAYAFQQACYLASGMIREQELDLLRVPVDLLGIHRTVLTYLSKHWLRHSAVADRPPSPVRAAQLSSIDHDKYRRAMLRATEGWRACLRSAQEKSGEPQLSDPWKAASLQGRFQRKYLELTVELILSSIVQGDLIAANRLTAEFLDWPNQSIYKLGAYSPLYHRVPRFLSVVALDQPWQDVDLDLSAARTPNASPYDLMNAICGELLLRFWSDLGQVLILLMLKWTSEGSEDEPAIAIAIQLLNGPLESYGVQIDQRDFAISGAILTRLIRQHFASYSYRRRLDVLCEHALRQWSADMSHERDMSLGWPNLESLRRPLLALFFATAPRTEFSTARFDQIVLSQSTVFDETGGGGRGFARFLKETLANAREDRGEAWERDVAAIRLLRSKLGLPNVDQASTRWVEDMLDWLEHLSERMKWKKLDIIRDTEGLDDGRF